MENNIYPLRYLSLFEQDLAYAATCIAFVLKNKDAALRLLRQKQSGTMLSASLYFLFSL